MTDSVGKRTEVICTKVDERLALDLLRAASLEDRTVSEFVFLTLRREMYGRQGKAISESGQEI